MDVHYLIGGVNLDKFYVYRFLDYKRDVVYVGKTKQSLEKRISAHFGNSGHLLKEQIDLVKYVEYIELSNGLEMDIVELYYINKWRPIFNSKSKYDNDYVMDSRTEDVWEVFELPSEVTGKELPSKLRVEVVLTEVDSDIISFLEYSDLPRATQVKMSIRAHMQQNQDEQLDVRIKRLLSDALEEASVGTSDDYKQAWLRERAEKDQLAEELERLRTTIMQSLR